MENDLTLKNSSSSILAQPNQPAPFPFLFPTLACFGGLSRRPSRNCTARPACLGPLLPSRTGPHRTWPSLVPRPTRLFPQHAAKCPLARPTARPSSPKATASLTLSLSLSLRSSPTGQRPFLLSFLLPRASFLFPGRFPFFGRRWRGHAGKATTVAPAWQVTESTCSPSLFRAPPGL